MNYTFKLDIILKRNGIQDTKIWVEFTLYNDQHDIINLGFIKYYDTIRTHLLVLFIPCMKNCCDISKI